MSPFNPDRTYDVSASLTGYECEALLAWLSEPMDDDPISAELADAWAKLDAAVKASSNYPDLPDEEGADDGPAE